MSAAASPPPTLEVRVAPASEEAPLSVAVTAVSVTLLVMALVAWLAARFLAWAMAPRRFRLRVAAAGALPVCILIEG
jgi:hypothetical protein